MREIPRDRPGGGDHLLVPPLRRWVRHQYTVSARTHVWKDRPENWGHLYTEGLSSYSRHINCFGDLLLFGGSAVLTRQWWTGIVPLAMGLNFVLVIIPAHDAYLAARYGSEFDHDACRTRQLVPLLY